VRYAVGVCVLAAALAQAAPDGLLFVREGQIYYLPEGIDQAHRVIGEDPGWEYTQPTWLDHELFAVMRLKDGELLRSHVGVAGAVAVGQMAAGDVQWLGPAGGAFNLGASPVQQKLAVTKLAPKGDGSYKAMFTVFPFGSDQSAPKQYLDFAEAQDSLSARLRFSPDGKFAAVPAFTDSFGIPVMLVEVATGKPANPLWLRHDYLVDQLETPRVSAVNWLADGRVLLGTIGRGLFCWHPATEQCTPIDAPEHHNLSVHDISVSADGTRAYYGVDVEVVDADGLVTATQQQIRMMDEDGNCSILFEGAGWPDAQPAAR